MMHQMIRNDKQVHDWADILDILERSPICCLAMFDEEYPYIVPLYFAYKAGESGDLKLIVHGANEGLKHRLMTRNGKVAFEMLASWSIVWNEKNLTDNTVPYESIMGQATVRVLESKEEKLQAMRTFLKRYRKEKNIEFDATRLDYIQVYELTVVGISAKRSVT